MSKGSFWAVAALLIFCLSLTGLAQSIDRGALSGTVTDSSGAVLPGAAVTITNVGTQAQRTVITGDDGRYNAQFLPPGEYTIEVSVPGFATTLLRNVIVQIGQNASQDIEMQVAGTQQTIEVFSQVEVMDRNETLVNSVINQAYIDQLPISGRDFRDFVELTPTAQSTPGLRSPVRLGGQLGEYTGFMIDGVDNRNSFFGEWFGSLETKNLTVPQDSIQEFQVKATGFTAEFGHATGGLINVVTKSGTNDWHGSAHWFFQDDSFIADTEVPAFPGARIVPGIDKRHQFGGTIGGPLAEDRAFIFFAIDMQQQDGPLSGVFLKDATQAPCPCPVPSIYGVSTLDELERSAIQRQDLIAPLLKFDFNLNDNNTATTRLNYTRNETDAFTGQAGSQTFVTGAVESNFENFVQEGFAISQSLTSVVGDSSVNEVRVSYSNEKRPRRVRLDNVPETDIFDTGRFGPASFLPIDSTHQRWQFIDNFSRTFGAHDLKFGVDLNSNATNQIFIGFAGGSYAFNSLDDYIARRPSFLLQRVGINGLTAQESGKLEPFWQHELSFYAQDTWRVSPNVTLNLGLRWDGIWNPDGENGLPEAILPVGKPNVSGSSVSVSTAPVSTEWRNDFNNFAPRLGFSWDVGGAHNTILRGGYGIYYAALPTIYAAGMLGGPGLRSATLFIPFCGVAGICDIVDDPTVDLNGFGLTYPNLLPGKATPEIEANLGPPNIDYVDPDIESARVQNFQIGVEQRLGDGSDFSVSATYTANISDNLRYGGFFSTPWDRNLNPSGVTLDQFGRTPQGYNLPRLDDRVGIANAITSFGEAEYHALIIALKKAFSDRYQFNISYTVSDNTGNNTSDRDSDAFFSPSDPFNGLALDEGRNQLDIRHQFTAYAFVDLPAGFEFGTSISARSGRAFPVYRGFCETGDGKPFLDCFQTGNNFDPIRPVVGGQLLERYPERNGNFFRWDIRFGYGLPLGDDGARKLAFNIDVFNLTDAGNFFTNPVAGGNAILGNSTFLQQDQTPGPINMQLSVKFTF